MESRKLVCYAVDWQTVETKKWVTRGVSMPKKIETELLLLPHGYEMRWEGKYSWFMLDYWVTRLEVITSFRFLVVTLDRGGRIAVRRT